VSRHEILFLSEVKHYEYTQPWVWNGALGTIDIVSIDLVSDTKLTPTEMCNMYINYRWTTV